MRRLTTIAMIVAIGLFAAGCREEHDHSEHEHDGEAAMQDGNADQTSYVNHTCPIMDQKITGAVRPDLTREFRGKTVAFCCSACPPQWDSLSEEEKLAKLQPVMKDDATLPSD
jgi:hypothetical protein